MAHSPSRRKRGRDDADDGDDVTKLRAFLSKEESSLRQASSDILNSELMDRVDAVKVLEEKVMSYSSYAEAVQEGAVAEVGVELMKCFRVGVRLECWVNSALGSPRTRVEDAPARARALAASGGLT